MRILAAALVALFPVGASLAGAGDPVTPDPPEEASPVRDEAPADIADDKDTADDKDAESAKGYKLLPIPVFITEPAIGEGLGVALSLFHPSKRGSARKSDPAATPQSIGATADRREPPPVVTAVFGAYTSNGTWVGGVGHFDNWREDRIRYSGAVAAADLTADFYVGGVPIEFSLDGNLLYQNVKFRLGASNMFLGLAGSYLDAENTFDLNLGDLVPPDLLTFDLRQVGLAGEFLYEGRDVMTMPSRGRLLDLTLWRYDEAVGSDFDYTVAKLRFLSFHPLGEKFRLEWRVEASTVGGRPPFFGFPWIKLRGIPAMRYQDRTVGVLELQGRYLVGDRWTVLAFTGRGLTDGDTVFAEDHPSIYNYGAGARFNIFEDRAIWVGADVAKGPEDWAWYIQVNHPW